MEPLGDRLLAVLERLGTALARELAAASRAAGLSALQSQIVLRLAARSPLRMTELADDLGLVPGTVSEAVAALVRKGLVRRELGSADRRQVLVSLTTEGRALAKQLGTWGALIRDALVEMPPADQAKNYSFLLRLLDRLQTVGLVPLQRMCFSCLYFREPGYCLLLERPLAGADLRLDCPDWVRALPSPGG